ncbi:fibulin-7 isoform X3 [Numida meleagris]|uniref:fibulin-7 isoform X3 n=1 Tax=Numida meleagris TaxID=8996 RepID=UPI000B3E3624|nr:fibulin-7 isoform X3 [Numida meleagris]XP_021247176.1 fibulin-7 isoform X3 [Numida meleagris]
MPRARDFPHEVWVQNPRVWSVGANDAIWRRQVGAGAVGAEHLPCPQGCPGRQQLLAAVRQMQQLLKGQETRFAEGLRLMKSRLSTLHSALAKAAPEPAPVSCPAPQAPAGGRMFGTKYLVEHEVHFACEPGFELQGSSTRICQADGSWSGQEPRCTELSTCSSSPCQNGGTCVEGPGQHHCLCPPPWSGAACQHRTQTEPPTWSTTADPAFSRKPRCAQVEHAQQCRCEPGFHMSGTASASLCQDVDECELYQAEGAPRLCAHACVNLPGSYRCACPSGYSLLGDGKSCEDIDECALSRDNCTRGTTCINTGGGFQCVSPECPQPGGNITYVKTSPFQCERNPCPMDSRSCHQAPKTISFHYLPLPSNLLTPTPLFRMATAAAPGRPGPDSLRFGIVGGNNRGHFVMQRSDRQTGELILVQRLKGPQTIQVDVDMSEYLDRTFQAKHLSKITLFVSAYEF